MKKILASILLLLFVLPVFSQTDKEKATSLMRQAIKLMDKEEVDESLVLLDSARKLDPDNFVYDYETGFAYNIKKDYKNAIRYFISSTKYANSVDQCYQMLGNCYDHDGDPKKAIETYNEGLKKFPNSGKLYLELGVMALIEENYDKTIEMWEKGISVNPTYPSSYYRLAKLYAMSKDPIWAIFYGEMFINLEWKTARTAEISKVIYNAYKGAIDITSDTSSKVDFARPMVIDAANFDPSKKFKFPFDQVYGLDFLVGMAPSLLGNNKEVNISFLHNARAGFLNSWYNNKRNKEYNNMIIEYQKKVLDAGHFEAYTYWLLMSGNEKEFDDWYNANESKFKAFAEWFNKNRAEVNSKHYFLRTEVNAK